MTTNNFAPDKLPTVTTNYHPRELVSYSDLPSAVALEQFSYLDRHEMEETGEGYTPRFFSYRGWWYDTQDCATWSDRGHYGSNSSTDTRGPLQRAGWHGFFGETYWSAVVFAYFNDEEMTGDDWSRVIVGHYYHS